jgi:mono/diheme cytochrome c family protein
MRAKTRAWFGAMLLATASTAVAQVTYTDLVPVLQARCVMCHQGDAAPLGLRLDSLEALLAGSRRGPIVKAGDPTGSELIRRLEGTSSPRMPMTGPPFLTDAETALFRRWVEAGLSAGIGARQPSPVSPSRPAPGGAVTYAHVAPIFATRCAKCHAERGLIGPAPEGYRLTSLAETLATRERARVVPGHPEASELLRRLRGEARPRMPLDGPPYLSEDETRLVAEWIRQGARDASGAATAVPVGAAVRLHGTLAGPRQLDGLSLEFPAGARIDNSPSIGDYVEVRGRVEADGHIEVERLRPR